MSMFKSAAFCLTLFMPILNSAEIFSSPTTAKPEYVRILSNTNRNIDLCFQANRSDFQEIICDNGKYSLYNLQAEGMICLDGKPILPAVSRFVIVPPRAGLDLIVDADEGRIIHPQAPLACFDLDEKKSPRDLSEICNNGLFPPAAAEMSRPIVIRGVRLVKLTSYPLQYDFETGSYIHHDQIRTEIRFSNDPPVNPVEHPNRRNRSRNFKKFIRIKNKGIIFAKENLGVLRAFDTII